MNPETAREHQRGSLGLASAPRLVCGDVAPPEFGRMGTCLPVLQHDHTCWMTCHPGAVSSGDGTATCWDGELTLPSLSCAPKACPLPVDLLSGGATFGDCPLKLDSHWPRKLEHGHNCTLDCPEGDSRSVGSGRVECRLGYVERNARALLDGGCCSSCGSFRSYYAATLLFVTH